ncbi:hypothetical protein V1L54_14680 [Streptomyces sp. TRM 70361]|uniref:effector-associated constant component EACC1 n=1 Tax=Streptomyces sp. TRM 70361 TaxID=3116553 RepID=UPI002E7C49A4|nr:hypothetical protein [Streptomyces sp. TRM 70361]MEE1940637.1 hypothetical protein [Streptomyces sp. TRM 70361]
MDNTDNTGTADRQVKIFLSEEEGDPEELQELAGRLRRELLRLDVADVRPLPGAAPPPGARAFDVVEAGAMLVTLGESATMLRDLVTVVRGWRHRESQTGPSVRVEADGNVLEITDASPDQLASTLEVFLGHRSPAGPDADDRSTPAPPASRAEP